ncbi:hypothetical protein ACFX2J_002311 [Malus domestica]
MDQDPRRIHSLGIPQSLLPFMCPACDGLVFQSSPVARRLITSWLVIRMGSSCPPLVYSSNGTSYAISVPDQAIISKDDKISSYLLNFREVIGKDLAKLVQSSLSENIPPFDAKSGDLEDKYKSFLFSEFQRVPRSEIVEYQRLKEMDNTWV